jgi:hypothetical protein
VIREFKAVSRFPYTGIATALQKLGRFRFCIDSLRPIRNLKPGNAVEVSLVVCGEAVPANQG